MDAAWEELFRLRGTQSCLWPFDSDTYFQTIRQALASLKLDEFMTDAYSLRHGGSSHDIVSKALSILEVKLRGRWKSDSSMQR